MVVPARHRWRRYVRVVGGVLVLSLVTLVLAPDDALAKAGTRAAHRSQAALPRHRGHLYVRDTFRRPVSGSWGRARPGGRWEVAKGQSGNFAVANGQGIVAARAAYFLSGEQILVLPRANRLSYVGSFTVSFDENINNYGPQHGGVVAYLVARFQDTGATGYYRMGLVWEGSTRHLWLRTQTPAGQKNPGDFTSQIDTLIDPTKDFGGPPYSYNVMVQITGTNPTSFASKVWKVGTTEPANWMLTGTDLKNLGPQVAGPIGFRVSNDLYTGSGNYVNYTAHVQVANLVVAPAG